MDCSALSAAALDLAANNSSASSASSGATDDEGGVEEVAAGDDDVFAGDDGRRTAAAGERVSLLERVVRAHPVWFLPHLGRNAAAHLLRRANPGAFIVRQSSSSRSRSMALTVRLSSSARSPDTDHYLIEAAPTSVRLHGSPHAFASLPILIEHYCNHADEVQTRLALPPAIMQCSSRRQLHCVSLLGQDFWTSCQHAVQPALHNQSSSSAPSRQRQAMSPSPDYSSAQMTKSVSAHADMRGKPEPPAKPPQIVPAYYEQALVAKARRQSHEPTRADPRCGDDSETYFVPTRRPVDERRKASVSSQLSDASGGEGSSEQGRALRTFKPPTEPPAQWSATARKPALKPKPVLPLRREKSHLGCLWPARPVVASVDGDQAAAGSQRRRIEHDSVEELRKNRIEWAKKEQLGDQRRPPDIIMKQDGSPHVVRQADDERRLSAASLPDDMAQGVAAQSPQLPRMGRTATGELHTINEGLVTPVVSRKRFIAAKREREEADRAAEASERFSRSRESIVSAMSDALNAARQSNTVGASAKPRPSLLGLGPRFASQRARPAEPPAPPAHRNTGAWAQVNGELKSRQRVAKVQPTVKARAAASTVEGSSRAAASPPSEYAQLSEIEALFPRDGDIPALLNHHRLRRRPSGRAAAADEDDDTRSIAATVFNEPWDSSGWENLLQLAVDSGGGGDTSAYGSVGGASASFDQWHENNVAPSTSCSSGVSTLEGRRSASSTKVPPPVTPRSHPSVRRASVESAAAAAAVEDSRFDLGPVLTPARLRNESLQSFRNARKDPGTRIQEYLEKLSDNSKTVFGGTLQQFIRCTIAAEETDPVVVLRNVRQFMNGMKNYLVKAGEAQLHQIIERERSRLHADEFLNIDAILEEVMHKLVLAPVKPHLYHLLIREQSRSGALQAISQTLAQARLLSAAAFGLEGGALTGERAEAVRQQLRRLQHHYSPLKKLETVLHALSLVRQSAAEEVDAPNSDELVRWLTLLLGRFGVVGCEVEAVYMWELLPPQLLAGRASVYLAALFSAVHVLKSGERLARLAERRATSAEAALLGVDEGRLDGSSGGAQADGDAFVRVAVPDERRGAIAYHAFPAVPQMSAGKLQRLIAHQLGVTNPEDHGLYLLVDGFETCLLASECPDLIRDQLRLTRKPHLFAYKRHEAKIAWPKVAMSPVF